MNPARDELLSKVRVALKRDVNSIIPGVPSTARISPRSAGDAEVERSLLFAEIEKLGGKTRRLTNSANLKDALQDLIHLEAIKKATLWQTTDLKELGIEEVLTSIGVEIVSPYASNRAVAECDLGITGADYALPETGTLVLRSSIEKPRTVSLLPRVHLAIIRLGILRADLHQVFDEVKRDGYFVFVTGPSRTADIELTLTIGVHGPQALHVWAI
jgi:L-lactate dehydrogenase complex protein LldG